MSSTTQARVRRVALIGNPNTGKTTLFNALTGLSQRVGNYPGVTVEKKVGRMSDGVEVLDLPGTYSLAAHSPDEMVAVRVLLGEQDGEPRPDLVVVIVDASNLERNLYLVTQVMEVGRPVVVALNMTDMAAKAGMTVDPVGLSRSLGIPVVPLVAARGEGIEDLRAAIQSHLDAAPAQPAWSFPEPFEREVEGLERALGQERCMALRALVDAGGTVEMDLVASRGEKARQALSEARERLRVLGKVPAAYEAQARYGWIAQAVAPHVSRRAVGASLTDRLDRVLTHRLAGSLVFLVLMTAVFMLIFEWAGPVMDWIDGGFGALGEAVSGAFAGTSWSGGALESLLVDGIVAGVGGVLIFLPQIVFLFLFISLLEDCGYMARAAFLMDRVLRFCGLSGHSFIPLMSSFACAIPGVMSARTISNSRDRLVTILVAPLMSCSARIPVYALMAVAFVPDLRVGGMLSMQGLVFTGMYFLGIVTAIGAAFLFKHTILKGPTPPFVMELPPYQRPRIRNVGLRVWDAVRAFVIRAGTIILAISVVIWALNYYPRGEELRVQYQAEREALEARELSEDDRKAELEALDRRERGALARQSWFGRIGHALEPAFKPLGWDWRIGMAALASFPAREVIVATLGIIYDVGDDVDVDDELSRKPLIERMQVSEWPDGKRVFNLPVALSIMVFFALCCQCGATVATIKRETNSWKWAGFTFFYMTALAYLASFLTYQMGRLWL
ncbi:MAG: ferrous iron transport protein B [Planctomycetota bacterium]